MLVDQILHLLHLNVRRGARLNRSLLLVLHLLLLFWLLVKLNHLVMIVTHVLRVNNLHNMAWIIEMHSVMRVLLQLLLLGDHWWRGIMQMFAHR